MYNRVRWFEHGRYIIAELTAEETWEFWEKDWYEVQWYRCPSAKRLVAKANRKLAAKHREAAQMAVAV